MSQQQQQQQQQYQQLKDSSPERTKNLSLEYGKTITLLRNGDEYFHGTKMVINSRKYRYYDVFLDDISNNINARFGAVRNVYTPQNGHRIKSLDEIEDGRVYVAGGPGKFKRLNYTDLAEGRKVLPPAPPKVSLFHA